MKLLDSEKREILRLIESDKPLPDNKDKDGIVSKEILTKKWTDWIDYWAVDFNFESKREIVRVPKEIGRHAQTALPGMNDGLLHFQDREEVLTGDFIFENEWQCFRTKKDRSLELKTPFHICESGRRYKIADKVVDIFGNDTMKIIEVTV